MQIEEKIASVTIALGQKIDGQRAKMEHKMEGQRSDLEKTVQYVAWLGTQKEFKF